METYFDVSHGSWRACTSNPGPRASTNSPAAWKS